MLQLEPCKLHSDTDCSFTCTAGRARWHTHRHGRAQPRCCKSTHPAVTRRLVDSLHCECTSQRCRQERAHAASRTRLSSDNSRFASSNKASRAGACAYTALDRNDRCTNSVAPLRSCCSHGTDHAKGTSCAGRKLAKRPGRSTLSVVQSLRWPKASAIPTAASPALTWMGPRRLPVDPHRTERSLLGNIRIRVGIKKSGRRRTCWQSSSNPRECVAQPARPRRLTRERF